MNRGEVWEAEVPSIGRRPTVILTRQVAIPFLATVTVAIITSRVRGLPTEVPVQREHGLDRDSVVNCDNVFTLNKSDLVHRRGALGPAELARLREALQIALELD